MWIKMADCIRADSAGWERWVGERLGYRDETGDNKEGRDCNGNGKRT